MTNLGDEVMPEGDDGGGLLLELMLGPLMMLIYCEELRVEDGGA